ncbi:MAG: hypothetical protein K2W82_17225 [Candidatus Obscuribacterales bacterium]|nr:hypothetical protein [Candidatus Obscuribacterales bacterium]
MKFKLLIALLFVTSFSGCAGFIVDQVLDSATENAIKLMEAQAKIDKEKRAESYTIEGRFKSLEMKTETVQETDPSKIKREKKTVEGKTEVSLEVPTKTIKTCVIVFQDGRDMSFRNVPTREMEANKRYVITYNGLNEITQVVEAVDGK